MSASACPMSVMAFKPNGTAPSAPASIRNRVQDSVNPRSSSPTTIRVRSPMTLPSIATTTCTSPSSPIATRSFTIFKCSASPIAQRRTAQITPPFVSYNSAETTSIAPSSNISLSCNDRKQPVATCPVAAKPVPGGKRKLGKGCSLLDWIRLCRSKKGEMGAPGGEKRPVTLAELAEHNTEDDVWTAIRGKVYNITHYVRFHPGGKEDLMKGAGIDCSILFDEVHSYVNVESTLKACLVGPLVENSPNTQRRNNASIVSKGVQLRKDSSNLTVPKPIMIRDGMNRQAVPRKASVDTLSSSRLLTDSRKLSLEIRVDHKIALRKNSVAATACEEPDGVRQVSPDSPIRPIVGVTPPKKASTASLEAAERSSIRLVPPPTRTRRNSEPHPRFHWVQSEKAVIIHLATNTMALKNSDVVLDINGKTLEAAVFIHDWVFELNIALAHTVVSSQVVINCGRAEISLKKETPHQQWESIGEFLEGHIRLNHKTRRNTKYRSTRVDSITAITHDTKLYTLRLPAASYLNVPTGHHLSIKAQVNGETVERSYTPVSGLERSTQKNEMTPEGETIELMVKLYKDGKMSSFLSNLKEGDEVVVSDPEGTFDAANRLAPASDILLLAAGSGFTPMVKILHDFASTELVPASRQRRILSASEASGEAGEEERQASELPPLVTKPCDFDGAVPSISPKTAKLIFANKKEGDVMWKEELEHLQEATEGRFSVSHILSNADKSWAGMSGRVSETLLRTNLPVVNGKNHHTALVCVCGPEPFTQGIVNMLVDLDYPDECIHIFQ